MDYLSDHKLELNELRFKGPFTSVVTSHLLLKNGGNKPLCYKVKTTVPKMYCVRPNSGLVESNTEVDLSVMLQPFVYNPREKSKHKFLIQSTVAEEKNLENFEQLWKTVDKDQVKEMKVKCVFDYNELIDDEIITNCSEEFFKKGMEVDIGNPPKSPVITRKQERIPLDRKKRLIFLQEKQKREIQQFGKDRNLEFSRIGLEEKLDFVAYNAVVDKHMQNIEIETIINETSMSDEDEILFDEIFKTYNKRNFEQINDFYKNVKIPEYIDPEILSISSMAAQYDCHMCESFSTDQFSEFYTHLSHHNNEISRKKKSQKRGQCLICGVIFPQIMLNTHMKIHIDHVQCNICKEFIIEGDLEYHIADHSNHHKCGICGEIFKSIDAIRNHYKHHQKGNTYSCHECNLVFASLEKLVCHISHDHKSVDIKYAECIYCFELTDNIKDHLYSADLCKFKCKHCEHISETGKEFLKHRLQHTSDKESIISPEVLMPDVLDSCHICGFRSNISFKMRLHIYGHRVDVMCDKFVVRKPRFTCHICKSKVPRYYLQIHIDKHRFYDKCTICKRFVSKSNFLGHKEQHEFHWKCKLCGELFPTIKMLADHQWAHVRLLPRPCSYCPLMFISEMSRVKHMSLIHKNIDSEFVECYYCKELIMFEIEYHILNANYCSKRCKLCKKRFKYVNNYKSHVFKVHNKLFQHQSALI